MNVAVGAQSIQPYLGESLSSLKDWLEEQDFKGYDPYDIKETSIFLLLRDVKPLVLLMNGLCHLFPLGLRHVLGVKKTKSPQAIALLAHGYMNILNMICSCSSRACSAKKAANQLKICLEWLEGHHSINYGYFCWGENFGWLAGGKIFIPKGTPDIVATSICGNAFFRAYRILGNNKYLSIAESAAKFILECLNIDKLAKDMLCFSYTPLDNFHVHNANLFGASLIARVGKELDDEHLVDYARSSTNYTLNEQNADGSFDYWGSPDKGAHPLIDGYHTGFVLRNLFYLYECLEEPNIKSAIEKGYKYYIDKLFYDSIPKLTDKKLYPIDIQSLAESILCLATLSELFPEALERAKKVALWVITNMQDKEGYFYYRKYPYFTIKMPYMRWAQAPMFEALSYLMLKLSSKDFKQIDC